MHEYLLIDVLESAIAEESLISFDDVSVVMSLNVLTQRIRTLTFLLHQWQRNQQHQQQQQKQ
jgi:hypothetical protein